MGGLTTDTQRSSGPLSLARSGYPLRCVTVRDMTATLAALPDAIDVQEGVARMLLHACGDLYS